MRSKIVAGNWKSNLTMEEAKKLFSEVNELNSKADGNVEIIVAPPALYLSAFSGTDNVFSLPHRIVVEQALARTPVKSPLRCSSALELTSP